MFELGTVTPEMVLAELSKPNFDRALAGGMMMHMLKDSPLRFGHMEKSFSLNDNDFKNLQKKYISAYKAEANSLGSRIPISQVESHSSSQVLPK